MIPEDVWSLPDSAVIGEKVYAIHGDFRDALTIFNILGGEEPYPVCLRMALAVFYEEYENIPPTLWEEAVEYMIWFLNGGSLEKEEEKPSPKRIDWEQDQWMIIAGVNKEAGHDIRALPFFHWWSFLSCFHNIGEGQLSLVVSIRDKIRKRKKLEPWEREFYAENKKLVDFKPKYTQEEIQERERLNKLLNG